VLALSLSLPHLSYGESEMRCRRSLQKSVYKKASAVRSCVGRAGQQNVALGIKTREAKGPGKGGPSKRNPAKSRTEESRTGTGQALAREKEKSEQKELLTQRPRGESGKSGKGEGGFIIGAWPWKPMPARTRATVRKKDASRTKL